jgi:hypothetical protein
LVKLWDTIQDKLAAHGVRAVTSSVMDGYPEPPYDKVVEHLSTTLAGGTEIDARIWLIPIGTGNLEEQSDGERTGDTAGSDVSSAGDHQP